MCVAHAAHFGIDGLLRLAGYFWQFKVFSTTEDYGKARGCEWRCLAPSHPPQVNILNYFLIIQRLLRTDIGAMPVTLHLSPHATFKCQNQNRISERYVRIMAYILDSPIPPDTKPLKRYKR